MQPRFEAYIHNPVKPAHFICSTTMAKPTSVWAHMSSAILLKKLSVSMQDEDSHESLRQLLTHGLGRATVAAELVCLCGMAPFLYIEAGTFLEYGLYGWRSAWNFMDVVAYVNQVGASVC